MLLRALLSEWKCKSRNEDICERDTQPTNTLYLEKRHTTKQNVQMASKYFFKVAQPISSQGNAN